MKKAAQPLVSIIVPIHNVEKFLPECLDSILAQTYKNIEIILVDDGSPDSSGKIADDYAKKDKRIKVIHKKNSGVSVARNTGIEQSTGEYICFVDGDDIVAPNYVEYLLDIAQKTGADISTTTDIWMNILDSKNSTKPDVIKKYSGEKAAAEILLYRIWLGSYMKLFKKQFLDDNDLRFIPEYRMGEGFIFTTSACQKANVVGIGQRKIYHYRHDNPDSVCTKFNISTWENGMKSMNYIHDNLIRKTRRLEIAWRYANLHTHADALYAMANARATKKHRAKYKQYLRYLRKNIFYLFRAPASPRAKLKILIILINPKLAALRKTFSSKQTS